MKPAIDKFILVWGALTILLGLYAVGYLIAKRDRYSAVSDLPAYVFAGAIIFFGVINVRRAFRRPS